MGARARATRGPRSFQAVKAHSAPSRLLHESEDSGLYAGVHWSQSCALRVHPEHLTVRRHVEGPLDQQCDQGKWIKSIIHCNLKSNVSSSLWYYTPDLAASPFQRRVGNTERTSSTYS